MKQQLFCIVPCWEICDRLVLAEGVEASRRTIPGSFTGNRIETVAVHSIIDTERSGDSQRICANDEHVARTTTCLESRDLEVDSWISTVQTSWLTRLAEIATTVGQAVQTAISNAKPRSNERKSSVDIKGFGKLRTFKGESLKFTEWLGKTTEFLIVACGSAFRPVFGWVEDQDNVITNGVVDRQFGPVGAEPVQDVQEKSEHVHVALLALTESESFDIVLERRHQVLKR